MMTRRWASSACATAILLGLSACGGLKSSAEKAVKDSLKDPDSARFGKFYMNDKTRAGCLTVNARNSMGGYTGDQQAFLVKGKDGMELVDITGASEAGCKAIADNWKPGE